MTEEKSEKTINDEKRKQIWKQNKGNLRKLWAAYKLSGIKNPYNSNNKLKNVQIYECQKLLN